MIYHTLKHITMVTQNNNNGIYYDKVRCPLPWEFKMAIFPRACVAPPPRVRLITERHRKAPKGNQNANLTLEL